MSVVRTAGVTRFTAAVRTDSRGQLVSVDFDDIPFLVRRVFVITDVPAGTRRGGHSHRRGHQALFCLTGCVEVELRRGESSENVTLRPDGVGLEIQAGVWSSQLYVGTGSRLLVLASRSYDLDDYEEESLRST